MKTLKSLKGIHILKKSASKKLKGGGVIETIDNLEVDVD